MNNNLMEKNINILCTCGHLIEKSIRLVMVLPCEHIFHEICIGNNKKCTLCGENINDYFRITDKLKNKLDVQRYIDILTVTNNQYLYTYNPSYMLDNMYDLSKLLIKITNFSKHTNKQNFIDTVLKMNYISVHVRGLDRIDKSKPRVYIANHSLFFDSLIIMKYIDTSFLMSTIVKRYKLIGSVLNSLPLVFVERGKGKKDIIINKIKEHIKKHKSICIYPEGSITNMKVLGKFRGGAFELNEPTYPIIIRYENAKSDNSLKDIILNLSARDKINIYMDVIGPYYPPFTKENIEQIRRDMANVGGFLLSRVSNRDIVEKKY